MAPTDEELLELMPQGFRDDLALVSRMAAHGAGPEVQPGLFRVTLNTGALGYARAVWDRARAVLAQPEHEVARPTQDELWELWLRLDRELPDRPAAVAAFWEHAQVGARSRFGRPAPAPAGEVAELVAALRIESSRCTCTLLTTDDLRRAADLLERQAAPVSVATAGLCELADDLREQASQGYCEFISREDLRRVADVLEQLAVSAHKQEPAVGPPSDDELLELAQHHSVSYTMSDGSVVYPLQHGCDMRDDVLSFARAVLARYGHQPAPPAAGEVGELVRWLRGANWDSKRQTLATRAADLLEQRQAAPVPVEMIPVEYYDLDSGARIVSEPSEEGPGGCWVVLNSRHVSPLTEFPTAEAAWIALQAAHALPLPGVEVEK